MTSIQETLNQLKDPQRAKNSAWFFKTGPGEYGEGDQFIGLTMPQQRKVAKSFKELPLDEIQTLIASPIHEYRMTGLLILVLQYQQAKKDPAKQQALYQFYLDNRQGINNWDLVDNTAHKIAGHYLFHHPKEREILYTFAHSEDLWERRIAVISTFYFIREKEFEDNLRLAKILLHDPHDLIHKAVGWMLREIGKKDLATEEKFLKKHYQTMPRTMLRYAIEKFEEGKRQDYLKGRI